MMHGQGFAVNRKSVIGLYPRPRKSYIGGMDLLIGCALVVEGILTLIAVSTVISIPKLLKLVTGEIQRTNAMLRVVDSNLDTIRAQLVETKKLVAKLTELPAPVQPAKPPFLPES